MFVCFHGKIIMYIPAMAILAGEPGDPVIILAATVVTVLGILVEPRLELTGVKAFFRFLPRPGFGAAGACDGTSVLVAVKRKLFNVEVIVDPVLAI